MVTRRWLLGASSSALAAAGLAAFAEHNQVATRIPVLRRRLLAMDPRSYQPPTWQETPPPTAVAITIGRTATHAISPLIYGLAHADSSRLQATGARLNRWGGNPNTRYNWAHGSAWNAARDWEFRNYGDSSDASPRASSIADLQIATNIANGTTTWLTVPAIGWVARDGDTNHRSIDVPPDGGPPVPAQADATAGYDPAANRRATSVRSVARKSADSSNDGVHQDEWIRHLTSRFGSAQTGGVGFYSIDNEPDLWSSTHTDVHPVHADYEEMLAIFVDYASAIKEVDPTARVTGPALSGWNALWYSARDRGDDNFATHADRRAHGDQPFLEWWLSQVRQRDEQTRRRLLDVLDIHYYPQSTGVYGPLGDESTQRRRLRSTRALWDPSYTDESWIGEPVYLIPRMRAWRDQLYPGTLLGIGEWNWGADDTFNGALAIANVLGIFGREGVDLASYWTVPPPASPGELAFQLFTNHDGYGHGFGDESLPAESTSADNVAVYASRDSFSNETVVILLNHRPDAPIPISLPVGGGAEWYLYDAADPLRIRPMGTIAGDAGSIHLTLPPESLSLLRITPAG